MSELIKKIEKEALDTLALHLTAKETRARKAREERIRKYNEMQATQVKEALKQLTRKCICCGAPWYEVNH